MELWENSTTCIVKKKNSKSLNVTKLTNQICDNLKNLNFDNPNCEKTQKFKLWQTEKPKLWQDSKAQIVTKLKTQIVTKLKNLNGDKTLKLNFDKTLKLKKRQH